ncbi:MAG: beta-carotene ketolase [Caulobacterales bacterium 32-69-10]|nr:MAG: beta-carotene ketolase [Caulobacterales bacterium 32-69-10]
MSAAANGSRISRYQAVVGLSYAAAIMAGWAGLHVYGVYLHHWSAWSLIVAPLVVAAQTWLSVGLFILAHDAMHGSLAPGHPRLNTAAGATALILYAGFRYERLKAAHHGHHAAPGTPADPDFYPDDPGTFLRWFVAFFRTYFGWTEFVVLAAFFVISVGVLKAPIANLLLFWAAPALLSAAQLFVFGTWLPHRVTDVAFADNHNARSSGYSSLVSLLTCFHFGRHHEHHLRPWLPWWRLDDEGRHGEQTRRSPS